jgi:proton-coupled amino acid transporter
MITQFGFCSVYLVFVGDTIQHVMNEVYCVNLDHRAWMAIATVPLVFFSWIKNLDHLASLSALANICIICGLAIIIYDEIYLFATGSAAVMSQHLNLTDTSAATSHQLNLIGTPQGTALFFGNALFSYEAIGIVLPLENKMTNPHHAQRVIYFGMTIVTFMYSSFGLLGYLTFGNSILASITLNLCADDYGAAILFLMTKILFGYSIFISYLLQFYVPMDFIEPQISNLLKLDKLEYKFPSFHKVLKMLVKCGFRTAIVFIIAGLAIGIPDLGDLLTLVGAVASSALALIFPPFIHILTFWKVRDANLICSWLPRPVWVTKDVAIMSLGMTGLVFGTYAAINNIVLFYENPAQSSSCNTTFQTYCHLLPP